MEKVKGEEFNEEIYENGIEMYLLEFFDRQGIDDIRTAPQNTWSAAMTYIYRHLFKDTNILKLNNKLEGYNNNNKYLNNSNCNSYNIDYINSVCDYYIYLCNTYDKMISMSDYCKLTGVSDTVIYQWHYSDNKLSTAGAIIWEKLNKGREESLANKLASNKNPVAVMAILNHNYGWNLPGVSRENANQKALTTDDIRQRLQNKSSEVRQIAQQENIVHSEQ